MLQLGHSVGILGAGRRTGGGDQQVGATLSPRGPVGVQVEMSRGQVWCSGEKVSLP